MDATGEGRRPGLAKPLLQAGCDVALVVEPVDLDPGVGEDALVVGPDQRRDRARRLVNRGLAVIGLLLEDGAPQGELYETNYLGHHMQIGSHPLTAKTLLIC